MTEQQWLTTSDPKRMLNFLKGRTSDRKRWLFAVSSFRRLLPELNERIRLAMETTERYADGLATDDEMHEFNTNISSTQSAGHAVDHCLSHAGEPNRKGEAKGQTDLLREVFGNPFRPITLDTSRLTSDVLLLARGIYDEKAFDRMPILADALQDAGCSSDELLNHCRQPGAHVRGCGAIDLLLGKS